FAAVATRRVVVSARRLRRRSEPPTRAARRLARPAREFAGEARYARRATGRATADPVPPANRASADAVLPIPPDAGSRKRGRPRGALLAPRVPCCARKSWLGDP